MKVAAFSFIKLPSIISFVWGHLQVLQDLGEKIQHLSVYPCATVLLLAPGAYSSWRCLEGSEYYENLLSPQLGIWPKPTATWKSANLFSTFEFANNLLFTLRVSTKLKLVMGFYYVVISTVGEDLSLQSPISVFIYWALVSSGKSNK